MNATWYKMLAEATLGVYFVGRLATYQYYNMDQVVAQALMLFKRIVTQNTPLSVSAEPLHVAIGTHTRLIGVVAPLDDIPSSKQAGHLKEDITRQ